MAKTYKIVEIFSNNIGVVRFIPMKKKEFENFIITVSHSKTVSQVCGFKKSRVAVITYACECSDNLREFYEHSRGLMALWDIRRPFYT